jgi:hypothetical protein
MFARILGLFRRSARRPTFPTVRFIDRDGRAEAFEARRHWFAATRQEGLRSDHWQRVAQARAERGL